MKKFLSLLLLASCQQTYFGLNEEVWSTLTESERTQVIDGYNKRKELSLLNEQKNQQQALENEHHRQEIEAQTAPIHAIADAVSSLYSKESTPRIQAIHNRKLTISETHFETSSKLSDAWLKGQRVQLTQTNANLLYPLTITNLDNNETILARKVR